MIIKNSSAGLIIVHKGKNLTYVTNILRGIPSLDIPETKHYEVIGLVGVALFKVISSLSLRHAYLAMKNIQYLSDCPEWGSISAIGEITDFTIDRGFINVTLSAYIMKEDYLI